jgi:tetratricopeptide (TPR) repeat protein
MTQFHTHALSLELNQDTRSFFFPKAKKPKVRNIITDQVRSAFNNLDGVIQSLSVTDEKITLNWNADLSKANKLDKIAALLTEGNYLEGMLLLEFFRSESPDDADLLYNLGMAYSDQNKLPQAIEILSHLISMDPDHINGRVALGVAFLRSNKNEDGVRELNIATEKGPDNPWAHRNLGAGLTRLKRYSEAVEHLRIATELSPQDQQAWYGYGQALEAAGRDGADAAYLQTIQIDEYSKIAELARTARSNIAQRSFRSAVPGSIRMDAVMYCLGALERFDSMSMDQIQKIGFEIAMLGTRGIDVNNPESRYTLKTLSGEFSGLHLLSIQYVAFKKFAPTQDIGFDLSAEYQAAMKLFGGKK